MTIAIKAKHGLGVQCLSCGHVDAPTDDPRKCKRCGEITSLHVFEAVVIESGAERIALGSNSTTIPPGGGGIQN